MASNITDIREANNGSCRPASTDVVIPGQDVVVDHWVMSSGSSVRKGETIAFVCKRSDAAMHGNVPTPAAAAAPKHKRPTRRKKMTKPAAPTTVTDNSSKPSSMGPTSSSSTKSTAMSLKNILAAKKIGPNESSSSSAKSEESSPNKPDESSSLQETKVASATTTASKTKQTTPIHAPATGILKIFPPNKDDGLQRKLAIGVIEECLHPTFLDGMCVVCGAPRVLTKEDKDKTIKETSQVTVSGGVTMTVSQKESESMAVLDSGRLLKQKKLSLVLDLDHTLVHATSDARARQYLDPTHPQVDTPGDVRTIRLPMFEGADPATKNGMDPRLAHMRSTHFVKLRPYVKEFLEGAQDTYEVSVYTAGTRQYAEEIAMVLCRKLAGAAMDADDLDALRYRVKLAEDEYNRNIKDDKKRTIDESSSSNTEHKVGDADMTENNETTKEEPPKKKKKVSFGMSVAMDEQGNVEHFEHMTKEMLESLQNELRSAEDLEAKARELRQKVFGSRIVSRTDVGDLGRDVKSLKRIFPCGGTMTAVVDDREDVWANAKDNSNSTIKGEPPDNLLLVRPYHWKPFVGFADINNAAGKDLSGSTPTKIDEQLLWTKNVLENLHKRYYQQQNSGNNRNTVPEILKQMRKEVLAGSNMVLSGLVPLHKQSLDEGGARPHFIRYAQNLGAKIQDAVDYRVTHVVASKDGTDKALAARKIPGCMLVKSAWLMECFWSMTRRNATPFLMSIVIPGAPHSSPPKRVLKESTVENSSEGSTNDSDDDDDFAAEFEDELMDTN